VTTLFGNQVPLLLPWLDDDEVQGVCNVIRSGWISQGPKVMEFERAIADYVGAKEAVATNACTSALHLSLHLSGIGMGDEVICPSHTCMATANAIHHAGGQPKFCDIDPRTYNLDPVAVERAIDDRTRGILLVHQIGLPAPRDEIKDVADRYGLVLVEDAACSLGATYKGTPLGGFGTPTCFSFHPRKMITTAEGGMIVTDDETLAQRARQLRSTGASISDLDRHKAKGMLVQQYEHVGYNYRMTDVHAAIGLAQLNKLPKMLRQRAAQAQQYTEAFGGMDEIGIPQVPEYATHAWSSYLVTVRPGKWAKRDEILAAMAKKSISCRVGIQPLHWEPFYRDRCPDLHLPVTEEVAVNTMFLPIFPGMTEAQQQTVIRTLKEAFVKM